MRWCDPLAARAGVAVARHEATRQPVAVAIESVREKRLGWFMGRSFLRWGPDCGSRMLDARAARGQRNVRTRAPVFKASSTETPGEAFPWKPAGGRCFGRSVKLPAGYVKRLVHLQEPVPDRVDHEVGLAADAQLAAQVAPVRLDGAAVDEQPVRGL